MGPDLETSWDALKKGISGIKPPRASTLPAGQIKDFEIKEFFSPKEIQRLDLFVLFGVAAARMALSDAGLYGKDIKAGVLLGSSRGGVRTIEKALNSRKISPYAMHASTVGMAASYIGQKFGLKGHSFGISSACASGMQAIGEGMRLIQSGAENIVLAGGAEAPISRLCIEGYGRAGALSKTGSSRPFDILRDGFVLSGGASVLVLEEYESAVKRGARIYGEISGYGNTLDAFHETRPSSSGEAQAMLAALKSANLDSTKIDLISAHATSTRLGDRVEAHALKEVFSNRLEKIPVIAIKSLTGHMLSASGPFEIAVTLLCMKEGILPPYPHLGQKEIQLDLARESRKTDARTALLNSFGFGGFNVSIVLKVFHM